MHHPKVVQSSIFNYFLKASIYGHTRPHFFSELLLQVSVQEVHNIFVSDPENCRIKYGRDAENNIIISDSILHSLLPPRKKMSAQYEVMCGCEYCISPKSVRSSLLSWNDWY